MWGAIAGAVGSLGLDLYKNHAATSHADFWNSQNIALQKEFAQNSIKWRVEDAKRAGVHPMAALGIQPASFSPVSTSIPGTSDSSYLADLGQNIDRAIMAGKDDEARKEATDQQKAINFLQLEKAGLENDLLRAQIDSMRAVRNTAATPAAPPTASRKVSDIGSPTAPVSPDPTGLISRKEAASHIWNMGHGNYSILWNPDYTQTIGDEAGQVFNIANASKEQYKNGVYVDSESGVTYVYNPNSGWWNRLSDLSSEEARRLLGYAPSPSRRSADSHFMRNRYRYRY